MISAVSLAWWERSSTTAARGHPSSFFTEAMDGLRYIWAERQLRVTTIAAAVPNFVMGFIEATVVLLFYVILGATTTPKSASSWQRWASAASSARSWPLRSSGRQGWGGP